MRHLLPPPARDLALTGLYDDLVLAGPVGERAGVSLGMVSSVDGAASVGGRTADLGGAADRAAFGALRGAADAVLVGAGTVRAEDYGPASGPAERRARRVAKGLDPSPRLVVVTNRLDLDPGARVFADPDHRPLLLTNVQAAGSGRLRDVAEVVAIGERAVDLPAALVHLAAVGLARVLCEGGPTLNAALLGDDLVDEVFLTLAPTLVGGTAPRIVAGVPDADEHDRRLVLAELREHEGELLLRYRRGGPPADRL